jgi:serpin B
MKKYNVIIFTSLLLVFLLTGCFSYRFSRLSQYGNSSNSSGDLHEIYADSDHLANQIDPELVDSMNRFTFNLYQELSQEDESNIFISPFSISTALTMLYNGVDGVTKEEMQQVLELNNMDLDAINDTYQKLMLSLLRADANVKLNVANSVWIRDEFIPKEAYIETLKEYFFAEVFTENFKTRETVNAINNWIDTTTDGMIDEMIEKIDPETVMYLINAIYFKGHWTHPFDEKFTQKELFHMGETSSDVDMMHQFEDLNFFYNDDLLGVELPYGRERLSMYAFVPRDGQDLNQIFQTLDYDSFGYFFQEFNAFQNVEVKLPKFRVEYGIKELKDVLMTMGIEEVFEEGKANLSKIGDRLFVDSVSHKAIIEVNEKGSEAAAATVIDIKTESAVIRETNIEPIFIADEPFFFVIRDKYTNTILFMGKVGEL